jgi:hypothetical protein
LGAGHGDEHVLIALGEDFMALDALSATPIATAGVVRRASWTRQKL